MPEPSTDLRARKNALRVRIKHRLSCLGDDRLRASSSAVQRLLAATDWWLEAQWLLGYVAMPGEVETREIIARAHRDGKQVAIPRIEGQELTFFEYGGSPRELLPHRYGVLEPDPRGVAVPTERLVGLRVLVLAPGLGFDRQRRRLGRGKGFYDRFLERLRAAGVKVRVVGLAFAEQLVDEVPVGDHDQLLDGVITDWEVIR